MREESRDAGARPVLTSIAAQLFVADLTESCAFFVAKLGFAVEFLYGDPPFYAGVIRDHARFVLRQMEEPVFLEIRERENLLSAAITVATAEEIERLYLSYQAEGVRFHQLLQREPWGARDFIVRDPDGNLILFAGPAE